MASFTVNMILTPRKLCYCNLTIQIISVQDVTSGTSWQVHSASFGMHILSVPRPSLEQAFPAAAHPGATAEPSQNCKRMLATLAGRVAGLPSAQQGTTCSVCMVRTQGVVQGQVVVEDLHVTGLLEPSPLL